MKVHLVNYLSHGKEMDVAQINYVLQTFFDLKPQKPEKQKALISRMNAKRHSIIDSGLFTLMFGSEKHTEKTFESMRAWMLSLCDFVKSTSYKHATVECDVQKLLGSDAAWELRREMKSLLPNSSIINVYHLEDENPDKLIQYSSYIAISQPELRKCLAAKDRMKLTDYIAGKATRLGKKVHLLGCTEEQYLKRYSYCFSCDSLSWYSSVWGKYKLLDGSERSSPDLQKKMSANNLNFCKSSYVKVLEATKAKKYYEKLCGSQE